MLLFIAFLVHAIMGEAVDELKNYGSTFQTSVQTTLGKNVDYSTAKLDNMRFSSLENVIIGCFSPENHKQFAVEHFLNFISCQCLAHATRAALWTEYCLNRLGVSLNGLNNRSSFKIRRIQNFMICFNDRRKVKAEVFSLSISDIIPIRGKLNAPFVNFITTCMPTKRNAAYAIENDGGLLDRNKLLAIRPISFAQLTPLSISKNSIYNSSQSDQSSEQERPAFINSQIFERSAHISIGLLLLFLGLFCTIRGIIGFAAQARPSAIFYIPFGMILMFIGLDGVVFSFSLISILHNCLPARLEYVF